MRNITEELAVFFSAAVDDARVGTFWNTLRKEKAAHPDWDFSLLYKEIAEGLLCRIAEATKCSSMTLKADLLLSNWILEHIILEDSDWDNFNIEEMKEELLAYMQNSFDEDAGEDEFELADYLDDFQLGMVAEEKVNGFVKKIHGRLKLFNSLDDADSDKKALENAKKAIIQLTENIKQLDDYEIRKALMNALEDAIDEWEKLTPEGKAKKPRANLFQQLSSSLKPVRGQYDVAKKEQHARRIKEAQERASQQPGAGAPKQKETKKFPDLNEFLVQLLYVGKKDPAEINERRVEIAEKLASLEPLEDHSFTTKQLNSMRRLIGSKNCAHSWIEARDKPEGADPEVLNIVLSTPIGMHMVVSGNLNALLDRGLFFASLFYNSSFYKLVISRPNADEILDPIGEHAKMILSRKHLGVVPEGYQFEHTVPDAYKDVVPLTQRARQEFLSGRLSKGINGISFNPKGACAANLSLLMDIAYQHEAAAVQSEDVGRDIMEKYMRKIRKMDYQIKKEPERLLQRSIIHDLVLRQYGRAFHDAHHQRRQAFSGNINQLLDAAVSHKAVTINLLTHVVAIVSVMPDENKFYSYDPNEDAFHQHDTRSSAVEWLKRKALQYNHGEIVGYNLPGSPSIKRDDVLKDPTKTTVRFM